MSDIKVSRISVGGKGSMSGVPDVGFVDLYVRADGMLLEDAIAEAKRKTDKIVDAIKGSFSEVKKITVTDVQVGETKQTSQGSKDSPKPEVIKNVFVVIPPLTDIAVKIVDMTSRMGASPQNPLANLSAGDPFGVIMYGLLNRDGVEDSAIKKAIDDAQRKAAKTGKNLGKVIGRILEVSNVDISGAGARAMMINRSLESKFSTDFLSLSAESVEVSVSLTVDFELTESGSRKISIKF